MDIQFFQDCARLGVERARDTVSALTGMECVVDLENAYFTEVEEIPLLTGYPDEIVLSSWVSFTGQMEGQIIILFRPDSAESVVRSMVPQFIEDVESENELEIIESIVSEIANIIGCSVLGAIADKSEMVLRPSPPLLIREMAGAILETAVATSYLYNDKVFASDVRFCFTESDAFFEIVLLPRKGTG